MKQRRGRVWVLSGLQLVLVSCPCSLRASESQEPGLSQKIDQRTAKIEHKVIAWRRDFHQHPELANREFRTSRIVADPAAAAPNHSPRFCADEGTLTTGVRALAHLAVDFLRQDR